MYCGIAATLVAVEDQLQIGLSIHDGTYSIDFSIEHLTLKEDITKEEIAVIIEEYVMGQLTKFSNEHLVKFVGAGLTMGVEYHCPNICGKLWSEMDIVPFVFPVRTTLNGFEKPAPSSLHPLQAAMLKKEEPVQNGGYTPPKVGIESIRSVDEQADSAVRKALMYFGPNHNPRLSIGFRNQVEVDSAFKVHLISDLKRYEDTVQATTWRCVMKYADILKEKKVKIAFFNSTPQGGGVALMRHAMMRFYRLLGVDVRWYVNYILINNVQCLQN